QAAYSAAQVALTAQAAIQQGAHSAFALCRPPGHHAAGEVMGGYCYLNNAAIAAQAFLDQGKRKVAILDVDYHHGNGTQ
ncbi:histone deacetylase family protein, partial [Pseudomonas sp. SIMBA_068]